MEQSRGELEYDELEKLLGEIPKVTSGNSHSEEYVPRRVSMNSNNLEPVCVNSYKGPLTQKLQNVGHLDDRGMLVNNADQSPVKRAQLEEANLPDDRSFTSAFAELSLNHGVMRQRMASSLENRKSSPPIHSGLMDDSQVIFVPGCHSVNNVLSPNMFDAERVGQEVVPRFVNLDPQLLERLQQVGYCQNFSSGIPPVHALQGVPFLSNMHVPGVHALMSDQPQYISGTQSSHYSQLNQPYLSRRNVEDELYLRANQHFCYLHNQGAEAPSKPMSSRQEYLGGLNSHQVEQVNRELFWNDGAAVRSLNHKSMHVPDKTGKVSYPEKILTRSHLGLNTVKGIKYGVGNELHKHVKQNGRFQSLSYCYQHDDLSSQELHPDTMNLKNNNLRLQSQKYSSLEEARGKIYFMAKDQNGCRFLQRKFSEKNPKDIEIIFHEIINHVVELMTDPFGNYLVQKLLEVCNEDQRMQILRAITRKPGDLIRISCDMHGTRAVQKVIETLKMPEQVSMVVSALKPGIVSLIKNVNGNHVAQRCLQYLLPQCSKFLFEAATAHCVELATDRHGCCVLQKCLSHAEGEQRCHLVSEITSNALILCQDPFGNYVLQFVFELQLQWAVLDILAQLEGNYTDLSMQKCSSNVVEKCLKYADEEYRARIIRELKCNARLDQVMQDPYGNYVIQAALKQTKGALHAELVDAIRPYVPSLRTNPYGKKVLSALSLKK